MQRKNSEPEFDTSFQDNHNHIAFPDSNWWKETCGPVGYFFQLSKGKRTAFTFVVGPEQCPFIGVGSGPAVNHIIGKVEIFGNDKFVVGFKIFEILKVCLLQKFFDHGLADCLV